MATQRLCSIPDCGKVHLAHGWCRAHYTQWRVHGDPLTRERPANGEAQEYFRDVVLTYDGDECLIWPFATVRGYGTIRVGERNHLVSRLVCEEANGPAPTHEHEAAHSCGKGNEGCATKKHLSWKTHIDNVADTLIHGTRNRGEKHGNARLTEDDVIEIRSLRGRLLQREIAERFDISAAYVCTIQARRVWAWLS